MAEDMKSLEMNELLKEMPDMLFGMDFIRAHRKSKINTVGSN